MAYENSPLRVGVSWSQLAEQPAQLRRVAQACGREPVLWDGNGPAPEVEVLVAGDGPSSVPREPGNLRLIQCASAGIDWLRDHPIWQSDVAIAVATGVHGVQIPEHVFMLLLALRRTARRFIEAQGRHEWIEDVTPPDELYGQTLGLVGYGHIGCGVAHLARAFGMRVLATSPSVRERAPLDVPGVAPFVDRPAIAGPGLDPDEQIPLAELQELLAVSDVVVICAPHTPQTHHLIDARALDHLKHGSTLINIARGKIVEEEALVRALRDGRLAAAGLDVTEEEPLPAHSPLWDLPNVIITPHVSGNSAHYVERTVNILLANIDCLRRGEPPLTAVDRRRGY